jgi:hypothetical protein
VCPMVSGPAYADMPHPNLLHGRVAPRLRVCAET